MVFVCVCVFGLVGFVCIPGLGVRFSNVGQGFFTFRRCLVWFPDEILGGLNPFECNKNSQQINTYFLKIFFIDFAFSNVSFIVDYRFCIVKVVVVVVVGFYIPIVGYVMGFCVLFVL